MHKSTEQKIYTYLGFAQKAGALCSGDTAVEASIKHRKARLIVLSSDAADSTAGKYRKMSADQGLKIISFGCMSALGKSIGRANRSVISICDQNFADAILKWFEGNPEVYQ